MIVTIRIHKAYHCRLFPTAEQEQQLLQNCGNARFVWNYFLDCNRKHYEQTGKFLYGAALNKQLPTLKNDYPFLKLGIAQSLQQVGWHFERALKAYLNPKQRNRFPTHKKKNKCKDSITIPQGFIVKKKQVYIPKIGFIQWEKYQLIKGKVKRLIIKREGNHWHCFVCCELRIKQRQQSLVSLVGIDVGLKTYATFSDGQTIENQHFYKKQEQKIKRIQRGFSRKKKDGNNRSKQRLKLTKIHRKVRNCRKDWLHKETCRTIAKYDGVFLETPNITGMMSNHCLAKAIADCAWYEYRRQLEYKAQWNSKLFRQIPRFEPTSKKCHRCGWIKDDLTLKDRIFKCEQCGLEMNRDLNAAICIRDCGLRLLWGTQEASAVRKNGTLGETRGCRATAQCLSVSQEQTLASPVLKDLDLSGEIATSRIINDSGCHIGTVFARSTSRKNNDD